MFKKKSRADTALIAEIQSVTDALARANSAAAQCADPLLFESTVYEIKYLQPRYAYLMNVARESGLSGRNYTDRKNRGAAWKRSS